MRRKLVTIFAQIFRKNIRTESIIKFRKYFS